LNDGDEHGGLLLSVMAPVASMGALWRRGLGRARTLRRNVEARRKATQRRREVLRQNARRLARRRVEDACMRSSSGQGQGRSTSGRASPRMATALIATVVALAVAGCVSSPMPPPRSVIVPAPAPVAAPVAPAPVPSAPARAAAPAPAPVPEPAPALASAASTAASRPFEFESDAVAARFPDPAVRYRTPAFEPGHSGVTSNAELRAALLTLVGNPANLASVRLIQAGSSQTGVPLEALHFSRPATVAAHPTVLLVGQQHGDESAGSEALLVIAQELANGTLAPLLERIDVVILPRANPDGAAVHRRTTASGIDVNRDHLLLRTPEAQAQAQLVRDFNPIVVVDSHEFAVLGRYIEKFGAVQRFDALVQYAMVANLPDLVTRASEEWFRQPLLQSLKEQGLSTEWYYTTSTSLSDKKVSMGGVQPDTGRNVNGLRNAVSILIETRGADLGRTHLLRRVHTHVTAIRSVLASAAARADDLQKLRRFVDAEVAAKACQGEVIVEAAATPSEYTLMMLDPQTGADKPVSVAWDSALALVPVTRRTRPCGYWLAPDQTDAVLRLRGLGVRVQRIEEAGEMRGEAYTETAREVGARSDVRGSIADGGGGGGGPLSPMVHVKVALAPALLDLQPGGYYVGLDQPLAHLVVAALEPDTQNSFVANRIIATVNAQARVLQPPALKMSVLP
jgi:hypothetical protein